MAVPGGASFPFSFVLSSAKALRIFPLVVYDISRSKENLHCSPVRELYCGFLILISQVVDVKNLD